MLYKGLLLDFDNTIVGTENSNFLIFKNTISGLIGRELTREDSRNFAGCTWKCIFERLHSLYLPEMHPIDIRRVFVNAKIEYFKGRSVTVANGLDRLLEMDIKTAIVTGSSMPEVEMFSEFVDLGRFDLIVTDELYENGKPEPDAYQYAMKRLGLKPSECIAVEDSEIGLLSAKSAGVTTVFTKEFSKDDHSDIATHTVDRMGDVAALLYP